MTTKSPTRKTAILYDFLQVKGGAESVTLQLCEHFADMEMIVSWVNRSNFPNIPISDDRVTTLTHATNIPGWQTLKSALSFLRMKQDLSDYDSVIYSGSNALMAICKSRARRKNIYYCHTPPRFVYDLKDYYLKSIPIWQRPFLKALIWWVKKLYERAIAQMDVVLCNSVNVQKRLKHFLNVDATVVYPPIEIEKFQYIRSGDFYLSTARLEPYKRVDKIVEAFVKMPDKKLVVLSGGSQLQELKAMAADSPNISFTGWLDEETMLKYIGECLATIYIPIDEDFGMSPVESMAAGKPVITCNAGGTAETVVHCETGWLVSASPESGEIIELIKSIDISTAQGYRQTCNARANKFSSSTFFDAIAALL